MRVAEDATMLTTDAQSPRWLQLMRAEYTEIPGLNLTKPQVQRLWGLDPCTTDTLLSELIDQRFLRKTQTGAYVRADLDR